MHLSKKLFSSVDCSSAAVFRIFFGFCMTVFVFYFHPPHLVYQNFIQSQFFFSFELFDWLGLKPWPEPLMYLHFVLMGIAAIGIMVGFCYRFSLAIFFLTFGYIFLMEKAYYNNHYYLVLLITFLMFFIDAHRRYSVDASYRWKQGNHATTALWSLWLLRFQIIVVYFFAGVAKLTPDWLAGRQLGIWLARRTDYPLIGWLFDKKEAILFFSYGGLIFDLLVGFLLCFRRTRYGAIGLGLFFHFMNWTFFNIGIFHFLMMATMILFLDPDQPHRWLSRTKGFVDKSQTTTSLLERKEKWMVPVFISIYILIQIALPLRHFFIPTQNNWAHQGYLFSWNIKADIAYGKVAFQIKDSRTGAQYETFTDKELNFIQYIQMATQPDMILKYAHHLRDQLKIKGVNDLIINADVVVKLNGQPFVRLIDPKVNLANVEYSSWKKNEWILPYDKN